MYANLLLPDAPDDAGPPLQRQRLDDASVPPVPDDVEQELDTPSSQEMPNPLTGVKFARMTGPEPFFFRLEHLSAMLKCRRRRAVNRLLRAIAEAEKMAASGTLPPEGWSWIMDSRLV